MDCLIEMLSNYELLIVFNNLDAKTLKNATLVCTKWNDIISQSTSLMSKYRIYSRRFKTYDDIMNFKRVVHTLHVRDDLKMLPHICSFHGSKLRKFCICNYQFSHPNEFHDVLQSMPLLEELSVKIINLKFIEDSESFVQPVAMKCLKKLAIMVSEMIDFNFRYLLGSQPISLRLMNLDRMEMTFFNEFLEGLERLESLYLIGGVAVSQFLKIETSKISFKLKKLELNWLGSADEVNNVDVDTMGNFLRSQSSSLEELSLCNASSKLVGKALTSLQFLKILRTDSCVYPQEKNLYDSLKPFSNLKELYIGDLFASEINKKGILRNCPMLITLEVMCLKALKRKIDGLLPEIEPEVKFVFLKNLHITGGDTTDAISFLKKNPTIEKLGPSYVNFHVTLSVLVDVLVNMPNLKYVELKGVADVLKVIYDGFSASEHRQPKSLLLIFDEKCLGFPKVRFEFPRDAGQWDAKCAFVETFVRTSADPATTSLWIGDKMRPAPLLPQHR